MPSIESIPAFAQYQEQKYGFAVHNLAISQSQVALKRGVNDATSGALLNVGVPAAFNGWVIGITANLLAVITHSLLALSPSIAAAEIASAHPLYRVPMAVATPSVITQFCDAVQPGGVGAFTKGQLLGLMVTTDANFLPNGSADLDAELWVLYDTYQP